MTTPARPARRWATALLAVIGVLVLGPDVAHADAAGPSDYRSRVVAVEPPTPTIHVGIVGGDSFVQLRVEPGTEVTLTGYYEEPFLRFLADGTVEENANARTTYISRSRFGDEDDVPDDVDVDAPPAWRAVGSDGTYSWHDHRAHWMSPDPPAGAEPGDEIQESELPFVVDGVPVSVTVVTDLVPAPSAVPLYLGAGAGGAVVLLALAGRRRLAWALLVAAAAATGIGWWQYSSLPSETGPLLVWWLLPAVAAASAAVALVLGPRLAAAAFVLLGAIELGAWVVLRADGAFKAVLPTDAPFWLDRGVLAGAGIVVVVAAATGLIGLARGDATADDD